MLRRKRSPIDRLKDVIPVFTLVALGSVTVLIGMNVLVMVAPVVIGGGATPVPTTPGPSFPAIPSYAIVTDAPASSQFPTASLPRTAPTLLVRHLEERDPDGVWDVSISYPAFRGSSTPWAAEMNDQIATIERSQADRYESGPAALRQQPGRTNHLVGSFSTELLTPALASFIFSWTDDLTPGQLAITLSTVNLDLSTGQPIAFNDMFIDPEGALQILSAQSADLLYYKLGAAWDQEMGTLGTAPNYGNFSKWAITKSGLEIVFDQYQVTHTAVTPSVVVPWGALASALVSTGPVADLSGVSADLSGVTPSPAGS
jgi:hypothetical protein